MGPCIAGSTRTCAESIHEPDTQPHNEYALAPLTETAYYTRSGEYNLSPQGNLVHLCSPLLSLRYIRRSTACNVLRSCIRDYRRTPRPLLRYTVHCAQCSAPNGAIVALYTIIVALNATLGLPKWDLVTAIGLA